MKHAIAAIDLPDVVPGTPPTGRPVVEWIKPSELIVDEAYQRDLSDRSKRLIRRIVETWDWRKFKPPIVAMTQDGFEVLDGQHSATAAVCHPGIDEIPVVIVDAAEQQDRASAFIGHNRDRIAVTAAQLQAAAATAGDKDALAVESACRLANVRLLRHPPAQGKYQARETIAAAQIGALVKKRGIDKAAEILTVLALAEFAPVQAAQIKAIEAILTDEENPIRPEDLTRAVMALGAGPAEKEGKLFADTHGVPLWRGLVAVWLQAAKKKRKPSEIAPTPAPTQLSADAGQLVAPLPVAPKRDTRDAKGGWAPGRHLVRCQKCDAGFEGGRLAKVCADCAYAPGAAR